MLMDTKHYLSLSADILQKHYNGLLMKHEFSIEQEWNICFFQQTVTQHLQWDHDNAAV